MSFRPTVERWRGSATRVAPAKFPVNLALALVETESGGKPGICSRAQACGLMQCKKAVVDDYNRVNKTSIPFARMSGTDQQSTSDQLRIGTWLFAKHMKTRNRERPDRSPWPQGSPSMWQVQAADLMYSHGAGAFNRLRARAIDNGFADTPEGWRAYQVKHAPGWTSERPFFHAFTVWNLYSSGGGTRQQMNVAWDRTMPKIKPSTGGGMGIILGALGLAWLLSDK